MRKEETLDGFTTVELIVVLGILVLVSGAVAAMTIALIRYERRDSAIAEIQRRATTGIEHLREAAKGANAVIASRTMNGTPLTSGTSTVVFSLPPVNQNGDLVAGTDYVGFHRDAADPTILVRDTESASGSARMAGTVTITPFVEEFRIRYNTGTPADADAVEVYLETGLSLEGTPIRFPIWTMMRLENK